MASAAGRGIPRGGSRTGRRQAAERRGSRTLGKPDTIDTHHHYVPPSLRAALERRRSHDRAFEAQFSSVFGQFAPALDNVGGRLAQMDASGVTWAVLSAPPPAAEVAPLVERAALAQQINDELLAVAARHPDRFLVALCLPTPDLRRASEECTRLGGEASVVAVSLFAHVHGDPVHGTGCDQLLSSVVDHRLALMLHPGLDTLGAPFGEWNLGSSLGAPLATTLVAVQLALSGALDRHPDLDVVVPHLGGLGPYLLQRLEDQSSPGSAAHPLSHYWRGRFFLDTCSFHPPALACALETVGSDRLLLGSDYPFRGPLQRAVADIDGLEDRDRAAVRSTNAWRLFGGAQSSPAPARSPGAPGGS